jgi:hypothetical protein
MSWRVFANCFAGTSIQLLIKRLKLAIHAILITGISDLRLILDQHGRRIEKQYGIYVG